MLWTIIGILVLLWVLGNVFQFVAGGLIHVLLVIALILFIVNMISGRKKVWCTKQNIKNHFRNWFLSVSEVVFLFL